MKALFILLIMTFSILAHADLADSAFAKIQYQEVGLMDVQAVTSKIKFVPASPKNVAYYEGHIIVTAVVEGNLCTAVPSSFGTLQTLEGKTTYTKLIVGRAWTTQLVGCPQYSRPTRVSFPISVGWIVDSGAGINQSIATFKVGTVNLKPVHILLTARGSQIRVSIKK